MSKFFWGKQHFLNLVCLSTRDEFYVYNMNISIFYIKKNTYMFNKFCSFTKALSLDKCLFN